jgi:hypothetical protein
MMVNLSDLLPASSRACGTIATHRAITIVVQKPHPQLPQLFLVTHQ